MRRRVLLAVLVIGALAATSGVVALRRPGPRRMPDLAGMTELTRRPVLCSSDIAIAVSYDRPGTLQGDADYWVLYVDPYDHRMRRPVIVLLYREGPEHTEPIEVLVDINRDGVVDRVFATTGELMQAYAHPCDLVEDARAARAR